MAYKAKKIDEIPIDKIIFEIFKYYKCPPECRAACCRALDISLSGREINRITSNKKNREKLQGVFNTPEGSYAKMPVKPCPFLNEPSSLCSIQKIKPYSCKLYPFLISKETDKTMIAYPWRYSLVTCAFGLDLFLDYLTFVRTYLDEESETPTFMYECWNYMLETLQYDRDNLTNITTIAFYSPPTLRRFLVYLQNEDESKRITARDSLRKNLLRESRLRYPRN